LSAENLLPSYESDMSNKAATTTKASNWFQEFLK
jgi:hypothetical protein